MIFRTPNRPQQKSIVKPEALGGLLEEGERLLLLQDQGPDGEDE